MAEVLELGRDQDVISLRHAWEVIHSLTMEPSPAPNGIKPNANRPIINERIEFVKN